MTHLLPVYDRHAKGYPSTDPDDPPAEVDYATLEAILTEPADFDAHFSQYSCDGLPHRLNEGALAERPVPMVVLVFDVDDPVAHKLHIPAREEWYALERMKISRLLMAHDCFVYHTRGGYRIVAGWLPEPFVVDGPEAAALWTAFYKTHVNALKRRFGIEADPRCADWQRQFRIPRACRDGEVQDLPVYGDPAKVGTYGDAYLTDEDVVEPDPVRERVPRASMRTDPPIEERERLAREHVARLPGSVQGDGAENTLWAACNVALVGYDLDVEAAARVIRDAHVPKSDLSQRGEEHFYQRMWKKLDELDQSASAPYGHLLDAKKMAHSVERIAAKAPRTDAKESTHREKVRQADVEREEWTRLDLPSIERVLDAFDPNVVRHATPFKTLNDATRGGFRQKDLVVLAGAPGAGKTSLAVQVAAHMLETGVPACLLAGDESIEYLLGRLAQRKGLSRDDFEDGRPHAKEAFLKVVAGWKLHALDSDWDGVTIEYAARLLHEDHGPGLLVVDSVQRVRSDTSHEAENSKGRVDDVTMTLKQVAARYGHMVVATSEVGRSNYRNKNPLENSEDLAAGKESGDIEYAAKLQLVLKASKEEDVVDVTTPKNRLGRGKPKWRLKWDYQRATFSEVAALTAEQELANAQSVEKDVEDAVKVVVRANPRLASKNQIHLAMQAAGVGKDKTRTMSAIARLELSLRLVKQAGFYVVT